MYLDANGDSINTEGDILSGAGPTTIDVWLSTNRNRDGSIATCATGESLSVSSYEFILHANGGTVAWSNFVNHQPTMVTNFGSAGNSTDYHNGFGGGTILSPGLYRLASITIAVVSGAPAIEIVPTTPLSGAFLTSFGSWCPGPEMDNTLKLGTDWHDVDGLGRPLLGGAMFRGGLVLGGEGESESAPASPAGVDSGCPQNPVACDFSPKPSITSAGPFTGTVISTDTITYFVSGPLGVKKGCKVQVYATSNLASEINTGGHCHDPSSRPLPLLQPTIGDTGSDGFQFKVAHTWPEVAGRYHIWFEDAPGDTCGDFQEIFTVCVRREPSFSAGMAQFPGPGPGYELTHGPDNQVRHPDHHYGTPKFNKALMDIAAMYQDSLPGVPILGYNDMSLRWGGVFDSDDTQVWLPGHKGHRNGDMVDMRTHVAGVARYTRDQLGVLKRILRTYGLRPIIHEPGSGVLPHWHLQPLKKGSFD
jgi:hypothetical protein